MRVVRSRPQHPGTPDASGRVPSRLNNRPEVNDPSQQNEPKQPRHYEVDERLERPSLHELTEPRDEKRTNGCKYVAG